MTSGVSETKDSYAERIGLGGGGDDDDDDDDVDDGSGIMKVTLGSI